MPPNASPYFTYCPVRLNVLHKERAGGFCSRRRDAALHLTCSVLWTRQEYEQSALSGRVPWRSRQQRSTFSRQEGERRWPALGNCPGSPNLTTCDRFIQRVVIQMRRGHRERLQDQLFAIIVTVVNCIPLTPAPECLLGGGQTPTILQNICHMINLTTSLQITCWMSCFVLNEYITVWGQGLSIIWRQIDSSWDAALFPFHPWFVKT